MPQATTHSTSFHDWALKMERRAAKREVISWTMRGGGGRPLYGIQPYGVRASVPPYDSSLTNSARSYSVNPQYFDAPGPFFKLWSSCADHDDHRR